MLRSVVWCCVMLRDAACCCVLLRGAAWCQTEMKIRYTPAPKETRKT